MHRAIGESEQTNSRYKFTIKLLDQSRIRLNTALKICCQTVSKAENVLGQCFTISLLDQVQILLKISMSFAQKPKGVLGYL